MIITLLSLVLLNNFGFKELAYADTDPADVPKAVFSTAITASGMYATGGNEHDNSYKDVFERADSNMYIRKHAIKAEPK